MSIMISPNHKWEIDPHHLVTHVIFVPPMPGRTIKSLHRMVSDKAKEQLRTKHSAKFSEQRSIPEWLDVDLSKLSGVFKSMPERSDLSAEINEHLVVELYSK